MGSDGAIPEDAVGRRVCVGEDKATVRYVGEIPGASGVWVGIEWDDYSRGKHDGSQYSIKLSSHPTGGSFIRPRKVDWGKGICTAIRERYGIVTDTQDDFILGRGKGQKAVEMVGMDKISEIQSQFKHLQEVSVMEGAVSSVESATCLSDLSPDLISLDMSRNLITSWQTVALAAGQLRLLQQINVSQNKIVPPTEAEVRQMSGSFSRVNHVKMNYMGYTWPQIALMSEVWPEVEELHICFNSICVISPVSPALANLTTLSLEGNPLAGWDQVLRFSHLKQLRELFLSDAALTEIYFPDVSPGETSSLFPALAGITLSRNKITEWTSVAELNKLASLKEVRLLKNPLQEGMTVETARQLMIALIGSLTRVNRSVIERGERQGAEFDYMKMRGKEWRASGGHQDPAQSKPSAEFTALNPRYQLLVDKWGPPEDSELVVKSSALKGSLISVNISSPNVPNKKLTKKLPETMTVEKVKTLVQRLLRADPGSLTLSYISAKSPDSPAIDLDNDMRLLTFYSIEEGDTIIATW